MKTDDDNIGQTYAIKRLKMQTKELGFVGLDYPMMATKYKLSQTSSQLNKESTRRKVFDKVLKCKKALSSLSEIHVMHKSIFIKVHG